NSSRCCARPTTPTAAHWRMKSGNSVTTSMRMDLKLQLSEFGIPVHHHAPAGQVHRTHITALDEGDQPLARAVPHHHHVVGAGAEQVADPPERRAFGGDDLQAFEVDPVILVLAERRQLLAGDVDVAADEGCCRVAVVHAGQLGHQALALRAPLRSRDLHHRIRYRCQQPGVVIEDLRAGLGPGFELDPALHAMQPDDASDRDAPTGCRHGQAACCLPASFTSAATLSLSWAPLPTHSCTRATFSSRRLSLPAATGL